MKTFRVDKSWARDQERMRGHRVRVVACVSSWLPLAFALFLFMYDNDQQHSLFELIPAFRDITSAEWLDAWLWILGICAAFGAIVMAVFWRCPECGAFLHGWHSFPGRCPRCDAKLAEK